MRRSKTDTLVAALERLLAERDRIAEAAKTLRELQEEANRRCVWERDPAYWGAYAGGCGVKWTFSGGGPRLSGAKFCPGCGGRILMPRNGGKS